MISAGKRSLASVGLSAVTPVKKVVSSGAAICMSASSKLYCPLAFCTTGVIEDPRLLQGQRQ